MNNVSFNCFFVLLCSWVFAGQSLSAQVIISDNNGEGQMELALDLSQMPQGDRDKLSRFLVSFESEAVRRRVMELFESRKVADIALDNLLSLENAGAQVYLNMAWEYAAHITNYEDLKAYIEEAF